MSSLLEFFKEKKTRLLWSGELFIQDCLIPSNRSITVCDGTFLFGFLWLGLFYAYWSISQKSVKGVVIQALFIMGGNSKNSDEIREKSTRAILVTQAVNDLGYSILASSSYYKCNLASENISCVTLCLSTDRCWTSLRTYLADKIFLYALTFFVYM